MLLLYGDEMPAREADPHHHGIAYLGKFSGSTMLFLSIPWARDGMLLYAGSVLDCWSFLFLEIQ